MSRVSIALLVAWFLSLTRSASADELTLDDVIQSALTRHPMVTAADQGKAVAAGELLSAEGGFDPSLRGRAAVIPFGPYPNERLDLYAEQPTALWGARLFAGWRYGQGDFAAYDGKLQTATLGEVRAGVGVPVLRDGPIDRRRATLRRAEIGAEIAGLAAEERRLDVARIAAHKYWEWVAAGRRLAIAREMLELAVTRDAGLAVKVERGAAPAFERAENQRAIHQRTAAVAAAEQALRSSAIELSLYLRDDLGAPRVAASQQLPPRLPEPTPPIGSGPSDEQMASARRPEPRRFAKIADQASVDWSYARNQKLPGLDVVVAGSRDMGRSDPKLLKPELEAMVLLDIPILNRANEGRARAAQAAMARAKLDAGFARDRIIAEVRDATNAMSLAAERFRATRKEIEVGRALIEQELQRFELGEGTLLLVNVREQALTDALTREVSALSDFHKARASLAAAKGELRGR